MTPRRTSASNEGDLSLRIRDLERGQRRWRISTAAVGIAILISMGLPQNPEWKNLKANLIEAKGLFLMDEEGKNRIQLYFSSKGTVQGAVFQMCDSGGHSRIVLTCNDEGARSWFTDSQARPRLETVCTDEHQAIRLQDVASKTRLASILDANGPRFEVRDDSEQTRAVLGLRGGGESVSNLARHDVNLTLYDDTGKVLAKLPR